MDCTFQVPDSNNEHTTFGNAHISKVTTSPDTNPSISANITKSNNTNENKTYKNMKKNVQRINESQLRAIVAESVNKVLKESFDTIGSDVLDAAQWLEGHKVAQIYNEAITHCGVDDATYVKILQQVLSWMSKRKMNENYDKPGQEHLIVRLVCKFIEGLKRKGYWDELLSYYNRGPEVFLQYIGPYLNMPGFLTREEESDDWDAHTPYDFSKIDAEDREREENARGFNSVGYNPYV